MSENENPNDISRKTDSKPQKASDDGFIPSKTSSFMRRINLLRLDYVFSVVVPCLMAIYINDFNLVDHLDIIMGFTLYAIVGNTLNDMIDAKDPHEEETIERVAGFHWKEIATVAITAFLFGSMMFVRTIQENPQNAILLVAIIVMVVVYCIKKNLPIINQILLGVSHVFLPYLMIKIDGNANPILNENEWILMMTFFSFAFTGQIVHEIIDGDSITKFSLRTQQLVVIISSVVTMVMGFFALSIADIYFLPFIFIPIGSIYTFRRPTHSTKGVKDAGIILGNIILFYFLVLIIQGI